MSKNIVKRFFEEAEEGMEAMQVVVIAAIAAVVLGSAFAIYSGIIHPNTEDKLGTLLGGTVETPTQQGAGTSQGGGLSGNASISYNSKNGLSGGANVKYN